jgi:alanine racemase
MRPVTAQINLTAIQHNCRAIRKMIETQANKENQIIGVIKADAYGHGAVHVARSLEEDVDGFAVASIHEALELRNGGITGAILLLEGCFDRSEVEQANHISVDYVIHNEQQWQWHRQSKGQGVHHSNVWFKVNTGMNRLGFDAQEFLVLIKTDDKAREALSDGVLMTHFSSSDRDDHYLKEQIQKFTSLTNYLTANNISYGTTSLCNSAALLLGKYHGDKNHSTSHRVGIAMYGVSPFGGASLADLKPAMTLRSSIIAVHQVKRGETVGYDNKWTAQEDSTIATIAIGYGDGYPRHAPSGTPVFLHGQTAHIVGNISMDMSSINITHISDVKIGDQVELWGENLSVNTVAKEMGTIGYELVTRLSKRVKRMYR